MNVSDYITKFFIEKKIKHIFGFQGGAILKIVDTMVSSREIEYVQNYHEQASSFCADSYSRVTGEIGVAIATSGPGATNLVSGIANAHLDSIPCLFITGQFYSNKISANKDIRSNGFQDLDIVSIVKPITKYATTLFDPNKIRYELEKCYLIAKSDRPGSVLIDIPIDIQFAEIDENNLDSFLPETINKYNFKEDKIDDFISLLKSSKRPLILSGGGIRTANAQKELEDFANLTKIPVVCTLNGIDTYKESFGFVGIYGNTDSNLAVYNSDLLIVLGSRLGQHQVGKTKESYTKAKVIHVDIDINELNRAIKEELSIQYEIKSFLKDLIPRLKDVKLNDYSGWLEKLKEWKLKYLNNSQLENEFLDPVKLVRDVSKILADDAIITCDVGQNQMWCAQGITIKRDQRFLNSSGLGSMGYSLPAAIGAKIAKPNTQVICFCGDGGFQMNIQELMLISKKKLAIKCFIFNNNNLGMTKDIQKTHYKQNYYGSTPEYYNCVDLKLISRAYEFEYLEIFNNNQINEIQKILTNEKPYIVELKLNPDSKLLNRFQDLEIFKRETIDEE